MPQPDKHHDLRYDEWKYRHSLVYSLMFRYMGAILAIAVFALTQASFFCDVSFTPRVLAALIIVLGALGALHMLVEFVRMVEARTTLGLFVEDEDSKFRKKFRERYKMYAQIKDIVPFEWLLWPSLAFYVGVIAWMVATMEPQTTCGPSSFLDLLLGKRQQ